MRTHSDHRRRTLPENTQNVTLIGEDPGVAAFALLCITAAKKTSGICITDVIVKTSKANHLHYHLGYFEFHQARSALIKLVRFGKDATLFDKDGNGTNAIPIGPYNDLLGKKIFADQDRGKKPGWCGHTNPLKGVEDAPSGRDLPIVRHFLRLQETMLTLKLNDYTPEWVEKKIKEKREVRDTDLQIAIETMDRQITWATDLTALRVEIGDLNRTVTLLTQERQREAMAA
jgi:hypothetical protein